MISSNGHQFGDTSLTKVFVGGLAWETPNDALREHFQQYGDILEAVIISDKLTSRSKGYGFVTFKEAEAAAKACQDAAPVINGRRANCNLASLGAKLQSSSPQLQNVTMTPQGRPMPSTTIKSTNNTGQVGWYYPARTMPYPSHHHHQPLPYYGFSPVPAAFVATNMNYNQKMSVGFYSNGQVYPAGHHQMMMPMYPFYQYHNQSMSFPAQVIPTVHRVPQTTTFVPRGPGAMVGF